MDALTLSDTLATVTEPRSPEILTTDQAVHLLPAGPQGTESTGDEATAVTNIAI